MFCSVVLSYIPLHNNRLNSDIYRVHLSLVTDGGTGTSVLQFAFPMKRIRISGYGAIVRSRLCHVTKVSFCCWLNEVRIRVPDHDCNRCTWWKGGMIWCRLNFLRGVLHSHVTVGTIEGIWFDTSIWILYWLLIVLEILRLIIWNEAFLFRCSPSYLRLCLQRQPRDVLTILQTSNREKHEAVNQGAFLRCRWSIGCHARRRW